jgi:hypothetical protein
MHFDANKAKMAPIAVNVRKIHAIVAYLRDKRLGITSSKIITIKLIKLG